VARAETEGFDGIKSGRVLAAAMALIFSASLAAAQAPPLPPTAIAPSPSVIGRQVLDDNVPPARKATIDVPPSTGVQVPAEVAGREVTFKHIAVEGASAFGPADFAPLFAPILDKRVPFSEVAAAVNKITALYQEGGYVFYTVVLPKQDLGGDTLRVVVLEGSVSAIEVQDGIESPATRQRIVDLLGKLKGRRPLKRSELERQLILAADTPGVTLSAAAKPDPSGRPTKLSWSLAARSNVTRRSPLSTAFRPRPTRR
jgi:hemolysin activation/secretion protein